MEGKRDMIQYDTSGVSYIYAICVTENWVVICQKITAQMCGLLFVMAIKRTLDDQLNGHTDAQLEIQ